MESGIDSTKQLADKLNRMEASRPKKSVAAKMKRFVNTTFDKAEVLDKTDSEKVELISNFVIGDSREEILDFIRLADSRILSCEKFLAGCENKYTRCVQEKLKLLWTVRLSEAISKGDAILKDDPEYLELKSKTAEK